MKNRIEVKENMNNQKVKKMVKYKTFNLSKHIDKKLSILMAIRQISESLTKC